MIKKKYKYERRPDDKFWLVWSENIQIRTSFPIEADVNRSAAVPDDVLPENPGTVT